MVVQTFTNRILGRNLSSSHWLPSVSKGNARRNARTSMDWTNDDDGNDINFKQRRKNKRIGYCCGRGPYQKRRVDQLVFFIVLLALVLLLVLFGWSTAFLERKEITLSDLPKVDFVVGGFPKCGTTTLLYALHSHQEILVPSRESCALKDTWRQVAQVRRRYRNEAMELFAETGTRNHTSISKRKGSFVKGLKCPSGIYSSNFIYRLNEINQNSENTNRHHPIKWIIGMRHPIWQVQSFYNYRITELYDKKVWWKDIRSLENILASDVPWKDMSRSSHKYEIYVAQLLSVLQNTTSSLPTGKSVFLYTLEQIEDDNAERAAHFRQDLSTFLGLEKQLSTLGKENVNRFVSGPQRHKEAISICQDRFQAVRRQLVRDSTATALWIQSQLGLDGNRNMAGAVDEDKHLGDLILVSNPMFLNQILDSWKKDPC